MADPIEIPDDVAERRRTIADLWDRYDGEHPASLEVDADGVDDNTQMNNLATVVDTGVDTLFGSGSGEVEFAAMLPGAAGAAGELDEDADATAALAEAWKLNRKNPTIRKIGTSGSIAGHVAVKLVPDEHGRRGGIPRVVLLDPLDWYAETAEDDVDDVIAYAIDTHIDDGLGQVVEVRREQHTRLDDGTWEVDWFVARGVDWTVGMQRGSEVRWQRDPARPESKAWPHPFPAIVDAQNLPKPHSYWGRSDLTPDIVHLQEAVNRVASDEKRTLRYFAHPRQYATGENTAAVQRAIDDASIGAALILPPGSTIGYLQMQAEGLAASAAYREALEDKLFEVARTPRIAAGRVDNVGPLSGVALLVLYRPLIAKTATKRDTYGELLAETSRRMMILAGLAPDGLVVEVAWPDSIPKNMREEAETALTLRDLDVSLRTLHGRLGIDHDREVDRLAEEAGDPTGDVFGLQQRVDELTAERDAVPVVPRESDEAA